MPNRFQGKLITFEGIDGSGKSTIMREVKNVLGENGIVYTKEPYQFEGGALDIKYPYQRLFRFMEDHVVHLEEVILPALKEGKLVLCDRYIDSNLAYRCVDLGNARNSYIKIVEWLEVLHSFSVWPDRTILFKVTPEIAVSRCKEKNEEFDINRAYLLENAYINLLCYYDSRIVGIDASKSIEMVSSKVLELIEDVMYKMARDGDSND